MSESYRNLADVARSHKVSAAAVTGWTKKAAWPASLQKDKVAAFVRERIAPNRKVKIALPGPQGQQATPSNPAPVLTQSVVDPTTASLEDLERSIRQATSAEQAEVLSKQVRALKVIREIQERDGLLIDSGLARTEIRSVFHYFQSATMNVPRAVSVALEGLPAGEIEVILYGRLAELIGELKRGLQRAIEFEAEPQAMGRHAGVAGSPREADAEPDGGEASGSDSPSE